MITLALHEYFSWQVSLKYFLIFQSLLRKFEIQNDIILQAYEQTMEVSLKIKTLQISVMNLVCSMFSHRRILQNKMELWKERIDRCRKWQELF